MKYCEFCEILDRRSHHYYDQPLLETLNFYVKPALGSLCPGHIVIISKECVGSIAQIYKDTGDELEDVFDTIKQFHKKYQQDTYFFEHGNSAAMEFRSSCIWHAHLHAIPVIINAAEWRSSATKVYGYSGVARNQITKGDYLAMGNLSSEEIYIARSSREESQFFRRIVSSESEKNLEWNYLLEPHHNHIMETIDDFKNSEFS